MLKQKHIRNTLARLEQFKDEIKDNNMEYNHEQYKIATKLLSRYMSEKDFNTQLVARMGWVEHGNEYPQYAHEFLDTVLNYKLKQATKNGKTLKNDPRKKAFIDISDCLTIQSNLDINIKKQDLTKKYGQFQYSQTKDSIIVKIPYKGNICIPFDDCYIYSCLDEIGCIVDIKTNDDATYSGTVYYLFMDHICIQSKFSIKRKEDTWEIVVELSKLQRPLGYPMCNVGALISLLVFGDFEELVKYFDKDIKGDLTDLVPEFFGSMTRFILDTLNYLSTYKSKYVYKLICANNIMYCYTTKIGKEVQSYMKEHYPQYTYEKLDGWIVNGYWKILDRKSYGINRLGKSIKGFDWVTPKQTEEKINSGEQQSNLIPIHAIQRAKERYKLDLTLTELQQLTQICIEGKDITKLTVRDKFGRLPKKDYKNTFNCYRLNYKDKWIDVVFEKNKEVSRIVTFLPAPKEPNYPIIDGVVYNSIMKDVSK